MSLKIKSIIHFFAFGLLLFLVGCMDDVAHDNPLDPANDSNTLQISGQVFTFYHPRSEITGATIHIDPGDGITISDQSGFYEIHHLAPGTYTIWCLADGYNQDSLEIVLNGNLKQDFFLDGSPEFTEISIRAHHHSRWFPREEIYFLELETRVTDPDGIGDIRSVTCSIPSLDFQDTLQPGLEAGFFSKELFGQDLPVTSIHQLIGQEIVLEVMDDYGTSAKSESHYLTRILEQTPVLLNPSGLESVQGDTITFTWEDLSLPFPASLRIDIFQISLGIARKVDVIKDLSI